MSVQKKFTVTGILKAVVITFTSLITVIAGFGYLYVNQAGGLSRLLETELATMVGSGTATVGKAQISVSLSRRPLQLTANDILITLDNEQTITKFEKTIDHNIFTTFIAEFKTMISDEKIIWKLEGSVNDTLFEINEKTGVLKYIGNEKKL